MPLRPNREQSHRNGKEEKPVPQIRAMDEIPERDEDDPLSGPYRMGFGTHPEVSQPKVARIPPFMTQTILHMEMQRLACQLTGGPGDISLPEEYMKKFFEVTVGWDGRGRDELITMASAAGGAEDDEAIVNKTQLFGNPR
jgi:hypothetical protein